MEGSILYINSCVRRDSRTRQLAERLLARLNAPFEEVRPHELALPLVDEAFLARRDRLIAEGRFDDPLFGLARRFANAGKIVIAAPYWDLSFPAALKQYIEQINVVGITFKYSEAGIPVGLCRADQLFYVTTAGGDFAPDAFGFGYIEALARNYYGIHDIRKIETLGLDIAGADADAIMNAAQARLSGMDLS